MAQLAATVPRPATLDGWVGGVSRTRGTATLDANPAGRHAARRMEGRADGATGTAS